MSAEERALAVIEKGDPISVQLHGIVFHGVAIRHRCGPDVVAAEAVLPWGDRVMLIEYADGPSSRKISATWDEASTVAVKLRRRLHPPRREPR